MTPRTRAALALCLASAALQGCDDPSKLGEDTAFFCGAAELTVPDGALSGDIEVTALLANPDGEPANVSLAYSTPYTVWRLATVTGETQALATSGEGTTTTLVWDSTTDLGYETVEDVGLKLVARSECGLWTQSAVTGLTVDNSEAGGIGCTVDVATPDDSSGGTLTVDYTLTHPDAIEAYITAEFSIDDGATYSRLTLADADCDGDGTADALTGLSTAADGAAHCLTWDSQSDFSTDADALVRLTCGVGFDDQGSDRTDGFNVQNDPTPDAGEVIFTEVLARADASTDGEYVELYNRTAKQLNLEGLFLVYTSSSGTRKEFEITSPAGIVPIGSGEYLLATRTADPADNGCLDPDMTWGDSSFVLDDDGALKLSKPGLTVAELDFTDAAGWSFDRGTAMGLSPTQLDSEDWDALTAWCNQRTSIERCAESSSTDIGTPGEENDPCR